MQKHIEEMRILIKRLANASKAYYQNDIEIMSNYEYDKLYDRLMNIEQMTDIILAGSPSVNVGYEAVEYLPKEKHEQPMLSLDKTKDIEVLRGFIGGQKTLLSWKMDGLTIVLTYQNGELVKAVTRGNGIIGEVITSNARVFKNIPLQIDFKGKIVIRGEAIITYSDFERINATIENADNKYKNPRNLCSGSVRQLNNEITAKRNVRFYAFSLVSAENLDMKNSREFQFQWLKSQGFEVVEYRMVTSDTLDEAMDYFAQAAQTNDIPSDGLVALYDDIVYGESLGTTAKFPRNAFAFKWTDEVKETTLINIEWSPSRTGLINPIAVFEPVELEGTTVCRASVHNISTIKELELGIGDTLQVYKANMIIPQIAKNLTRSNKIEIPCQCPVCHHDTIIRNENGVESLHCTNSDCIAKRIKAFNLFVSRDGMNINGLSESTIEKFIAKGFIHNFNDIYEIEKHRDEIIQMEGFGLKSFEKLVQSINNSKEVTLTRLIYALGIPNLGFTNAKVICEYFNDDLEAIKNASIEEISSIKGIGPIIARSLTDYLSDQNNQKQLNSLLKHLNVKKETQNERPILSGMSFVITGSTETFANRRDLKGFIEDLGGRVTDSVTAKTSYLINNDSSSNSSKNRKAKEFGIKIISECMFMEMISLFNLPL